MRKITVMLFTGLLLCSGSFSARAAEMKDQGVFKEKTPDGKLNRVYSVYTPDLNWEAMQKYAQAKEWDGAGTSTTVCFFNDWRNTPDVTFTGMNFSETYKDAWVGGYWRYANGNEVFVQYPAKRRQISAY